MIILTLVSMESSHLVIFSTSGKFITKFNVLRCISLSTPYNVGSVLWGIASVHVGDSISTVEDSISTAEE